MITREQYETLSKNYLDLKEKYAKLKENAITIPKGATNGDMMKAIFGFEPRKNTCILPLDYCNGNPTECDGCRFNDWWNAPYEREVEK